MVELRSPLCLGALLLSLLGGEWNKHVYNIYIPSRDGCYYSLGCLRLVTRPEPRNITVSHTTLRVGLEQLITKVIGQSSSIISRLHHLSILLVDPLHRHPSVPLNRRNVTKFFPHNRGMLRRFRCVLIFLFKKVRCNSSFSCFLFLFCLVSLHGDQCNCTVER